ncbi:hypothetical protein Bca4012_078895 [Brassica carinata]
MVPPATERRNKSSDPGPVPNVLRIKPSPFSAPDSGKVVIYPSSSGGWDEGVIGMQIGEVARLRHVVSKVCGIKV